MSVVDTISTYAKSPLDLFRHSDFVKGDKAQLKFGSRRKFRFLITHLPVPFLSPGVLMVILISIRVELCYFR